MSNNISFVGRVGRDAELKEIGSNVVLEFSVANDTGYGDRKVTNWFNVSMWGKRGQAIQQYILKGKQVFITGELTLRTYTNKDGVEKMSPDVNISHLDFLSGDKEESDSAPSAPSGGSKPSPETDEDMPF